MPSLEQLFAADLLHKPDAAVGFWIWRLSLGYQRRAEAVLKTIGLTHLQYVVLALSAWLSHTTSEVSQRDLVALSGVHESQISLMVKALKTKKLISQRQSSQDTRVRLIVVTDAGIEMLLKANPLMTALGEELWPAAGEMDTLFRQVESAVRRWDGEAG